MNCTRRRPMGLWRRATCGGLRLCAPAEGWTSGVGPSQACRGGERPGLQQLPWRQPAVLPPPAADGRLAACNQPSVSTMTSAYQIIRATLSLGSRCLRCCSCCKAGILPIGSCFVLVQANDKATDRLQSASSIQVYISRAPMHVMQGVAKVWTGHHSCSRSCAC